MNTAAFDQRYDSPHVSTASHRSATVGVDDQTATATPRDALGNRDSRDTPSSCDRGGGDHPPHGQ
jgi:hypothetical protein